MSPLFINNKNLGILTDMKDISQISTNRTNTPQSIATSLLCEVCHHCFTPN
jgi:transcriptional regulator of met regulon